MELEQKLCIKTRSGFKIINLIYVAYCQANGSYTDFIFIGNSDKCTASSNLKEINSKLPAYFFQCHRKYIVNMNLIKEVKYNRIIMEDESVIYISPQKKTELIKLFLG